MNTIAPQLRCRIRLQHLLLLALFPALLAGCSFRKMAVSKVGDALSSGGSTYSSDDDPEIVRAAVPFSLKLMESLLAEVPQHQGLLLSTASGFTQFAYAFVQQDADELESRDVSAANTARVRARKLYLRARDYGLRGLAARHRGFEKELRAHPKTAVAPLKKAVVALMYWTAVSWAAAISLSKDNPELIADLAAVEALVDCALQLDESFDHGALHSFLINFEMARQGGTGDPAVRARTHFDRAMELSGGSQAGPLVSYAEAVTIQQQDKKAFQELLQRALEIKPDADPATRLMTLVMQRRARWLLARTDELFLE